MTFSPKDILKRKLQISLPFYAKDLPFYAKDLPPTAQWQLWSDAKMLYGLSSSASKEITILTIRFKK